MYYNIYTNSLFSYIYRSFFNISGIKKNRNNEKK